MILNFEGTVENMMTDIKKTMIQYSVVVYFSSVINYNTHEINIVQYKRTEGATQPQSEGHAVQYHMV